VAYPRRIIIRAEAKKKKLATKAVKDGSVLATETTPVSVVLPNNSLPLEQELPLTFDDYFPNDDDFLPNNEDEDGDEGAGDSKLLLWMCMTRPDRLRPVKVIYDENDGGQRHRDEARCSRAVERGYLPHTTSLERSAGDQHHRIDLSGYGISDISVVRLDLGCLDEVALNPIWQPEAYLNTFMASEAFFTNFMRLTWASLKIGSSIFLPLNSLAYGMLDRKWDCFLCLQTNRRSFEISKNKLASL
jgi:hypothetical protein